MVEEQASRAARDTGILVGLTGQSGAGKTLVCDMLAERDYPVINADRVARQVVAKGKKCLIELALEFGIEILESDGTLNRRRLGAIVFSDKEKRKALNRITFPYIQEEIFDQVEKQRAKGKKIIFLDAPTLIESGTHKQCDLVVSVLAPEPERLRRILHRDRITQEEAENRLRAQHDDQFYISHSNFIIENNGNLSALRVSVLEMLDRVEHARRGGDGEIHREDGVPEGAGED